MSFFDDVDEPRTAPQPTPRRRTSSGAPRRSGGGGGARRPPGPRRSARATDDRTLRQRRLVFGGGLLIVVILMALLINSCQASSHASALRDYNTSVGNLIAHSDTVSQQLFADDLAHPGTAADSEGLRTRILTAADSAQSQLTQAESLSPPSELSSAQRNLVLTMSMRRDGIRTIAANIEPALGTSTNRSAVSQIAAAMAQFYASDVIYKVYVAPQIAEALHGAGISVGGANGQQIASGQFLPSLSWLQPTSIDAALGSPAAAQTGPLAPGTHGHSLNSVSVNGTTLSPSSANAITASPAPTFQLSLTNSGENAETDVECKVTVKDTSIAGHSILARTTPGETTTCNVTLASSPPAGQYHVTAEVVPVRGEKNKANNFLTFPVTFQ